MSLSDAARFLSEEAAAEAAGHEENHVVIYAIVVACLGVLLGTFLRWLEVQIVPDLQEWRFGRFVGMPPYTLSVFLMGILTSAVHDALNLGGRTYEGLALAGSQPTEPEPLLITLAIRATQRVDAHVILLVLLPPLIYESASHMSWHVFSRVSGQAFILAFPGVIIQACARRAARLRARRSDVPALRRLTASHRAVSRARARE